MSILNCDQAICAKYISVKCVDEMDMNNETKGTMDLTVWRATWISGTNQHLWIFLKDKLYSSEISFWSLKSGCSLFNEGCTISDNNMKFMNTYTENIWRIYNVIEDLELPFPQLIGLLHVIWNIIIFWNKQDKTSHPALEMWKSSIVYSFT